MSVLFSWPCPWRWRSVRLPFRNLFGQLAAASYDDMETPRWRVAHRDIDEINWHAPMQWRMETCSLRAMHFR